MTCDSAGLIRVCGVNEVRRNQIESAHGCRENQPIPLGCRRVPVHTALNAESSNNGSNQCDQGGVRGVPVTDFSGSIAKLTRADQRLRDLVGEVRAYFDPSPFDYTTQHRGAASVIRLEL